jgi:hypothetical protein
VTPVVGKTLEMGVVVLFIGLLTAVLLGGVVPEYRSATSATVGERVLTAASQDVERAVPPATGPVRTQTHVTLPGDIAGQSYAIDVDGRHLVLHHPDPVVSGRVRLVLPSTVDSIDGRWQSGASTVVRVSGDESGLAIELTDEEMR